MFDGLAKALMLSAGKGEQIGSKMMEVHNVGQSVKFLFELVHPWERGKHVEWVVLRLHRGASHFNREGDSRRPR
jgi:hypothetical protein